jgi:hypothetical protein
MAGEGIKSNTRSVAQRVRIFVRRGRESVVGGAEARREGSTYMGEKGRTNSPRKSSRMKMAAADGGRSPVNPSWIALPPSLTTSHPLASGPWDEFHNYGFVGRF